MDADELTFIYLQESSVTLTTIKMIALASLWLITPSPFPYPHLKLEHFKIAKDRPPPSTTHIHFQSSGPYLDQAVEWQSGSTSSLPQDYPQKTVHRQRSYPDAVSMCACVNSLHSIITQSKANLSGMWVELYKNTMSHLILPIVAIRRARRQHALTVESHVEKVANSHLPTEMRRSESSLDV